MSIGIDYGGARFDQSMTTLHSKQTMMARRLKKVIKKLNANTLNKIGSWFKGMVASVKEAFTPTPSYTACLA